MGLLKEWLMLLVMLLVESVTFSEVSGVASSDAVILMMVQSTHMQLLLLLVSATVQLESLSMVLSKLAFLLEVSAKLLPTSNLLWEMRSISLHTLIPKDCKGCPPSPLPRTDQYRSSQLCYGFSEPKSSLLPRQQLGQLDTMSLESVSKTCSSWQPESSI